MVYLFAAVLVVAAGFRLEAGLLITGRCSKLLLFFLVIPADVVLELPLCCCWRRLLSSMALLLLPPGLLLLGPLVPEGAGEAARCQVALLVAS
jgi:hypothetical protein